MVEKRKRSKKEADPVVEDEIRVTDFISVHMIIDEPNTPIGSVGWVHTHGMWENFGLPDLEIRGVRPSFLMPDAGRLLNHLAQYMLDSKLGLPGTKPIKAGETFGTSVFQTMRIVESTPINPDDKAECETHFVDPRWELIPIPQRCVKCGKEHGKETIH